MKLMIKNMVCPRCISSVEGLLRQYGIKAKSVRLGEVETEEPVSTELLDQLNASLRQLGFELLDDQRKQLIDRIKTLLLQKVQSGDIEEHFSISKYLSSSLNRDYSFLSKLFSEVEGVTLEHYFILQKIEKAKEWLMYNEHTVSEISYLLGYSSAQHLSTQFKKLTGMTPGQFRKNGSPLRKSLDNLI